MRYKDGEISFSTWRYPLCIGGWTFPYQIYANALAMDLNIISDNKGEIRINCYRCAGVDVPEMVYSAQLENGDNSIHKIIKGPCFSGLSFELNVPEGTKIQLAKFELQRQDVADE